MMSEHDRPAHRRLRDMLATPIRESLFTNAERRQEQIDIKRAAEAMEREVFGSIGGSLDVDWAMRQANISQASLAAMAQQAQAAQAAMAQQAQAVQSAAAMAQAQAYRDVVIVVPVQERIRRQLGRLSDELPHRVLQRITKCAAQSDGATMRYVLEYNDGRRIQFDNVDTFPTDADIARIALDAP